MKKNKMIILICLFFLSACSGSLTTVGNPKGITIDVNLTNDVAGEAESVKAVTVNPTPDGYIVGVRRLAILLCDDGDDDGDNLCPGDAGEEIENAGINQDDDTDNDVDILATLFLTEDNLFVDQLVYDAGSFPFGNSDPLETLTIIEDDIEEEGNYSAFQLQMDFVALEAPDIGGTVSFPAGVADNSFDLLLLCINELGCSSETFSSYTASYLSPLQEETEVALGDLVFIDADSSSAFWWDAGEAEGEFISVGEARPSNPLSQSVDDLFYDADTGEMIYNASLGSEQEGGIDSIPITQALANENTELQLNVVFSITDTSLSWDENDEDGDDIISSADEMNTLAVGKPQIVEFELE